jgi:endonuclease/exonuclease/phosphatase family metal-dependent hydrolase
VKRNIKRTLLILNILLVMGTLLAYASPAIHPEASPFPGIFGLFFPVLFFLNLFAILFWLSFGRWYALLSIVCLVAGYPRIRNFIQPGIHSKAPEQDVLRVATYNVFSFHRVGQSEAMIRRTFLEIAHELGDPDVMCLQESAWIGKESQPVGPYQYVYTVPHSGTVLLSRFRIIRSGQVYSGDVPSLSGWVDIIVRGDTIRVYGLHLVSNRITEETEQLFEEKRFQDSRTWVIAGDLIRKYSAASATRADQADVIRQHLSGSPYATIVVGDFNDTPQSYAYATIRGEDLEDSFVLRGGGIGSTYGGNIPGLRIDYILTDRKFTVLDHRVYKLPYSDHYAVVVDCALHPVDRG